MLALVQESLPVGEEGETSWPLPSCRIRAEIITLGDCCPGQRRFARPFTRRLLCLLSYTGG
jgi:hypothetical protein